MRIPLTRYGWPQVAVYPAGIILTMVIVAVAGPWSNHGLLTILIELVLAAVLVWALAFFRDPDRRPPQDEAVLVAPADGTIADIETVPAQTAQTGSVPICRGAGTLRIGIFLSIFSVHINRAPCRVKVEKTTYHKGRYLNAMNPLSGQVNESNDLTLRRVNDPKNCLVVRQVSGAIARRIVCAATTGQELAQGEAFGMIKFGSRTELHIPTDGNVECLVRIGDKVKAGQTVLARYSKT
jgi:phosphatidylserine decarboxylase